ncbi:MAG: hypothetical protein PHN84_11895 [Desulfuromonadaceae bacterium]|nr:hypothetical protein [Desulfuromonadaceae bacterium]MDD2855891.1 hypothetical protein [Desulfuromonadaceae bacterium]
MFLARMLIICCILLFCSSIVVDAAETVGVMSMSVEKSRLYLGESTIATITLLTGAERVDNLGYPVLAVKKATVGEFILSDQHEYMHEGRSAVRYRFTARVTPLDSGVISLGPARLAGEVLETAGDSTGFFGGTISKKISFEAPKVDLVVLPLPTVGRPAGFSGVIGRLNMKVSAEPASLSLGTPLTVKTSITGSGNISKAKCPEVDDPDFKCYPPRIRRSDNMLLCTQVVIPQNTSITSLPPLLFSFFNSSTARYESLKSISIPLTVLERKSGQASVPTGLQLPKFQESKPLVQFFRWWQGLLFAVLSVITLFLVRYIKNVSKDEMPFTVNNSASQRLLYAEYLQIAEDALSINDVEKFYLSLFRALEIIESKTDIAESSEINLLFEECIAVRYGRRKSDHEEMELVLGRMKSLQVFAQPDAA